MPGSSHDLERLRRCLSRIARLEGVVLRTADGPLLFDAVTVIDPRPAVEEAIQSGVVTEATVKASFASPTKRTPTRLTTRWLAAAQRDIARVRAQQDAFWWVKNASKVLGTYSHVDERWLDLQQARLHALSKEIETPAAGGFDGALALIRAVHGHERARRVAALAEQSERVGRAARRRAEHRLDALIEALEGRGAASHAESAAERVRGVDRPGARPRRQLARTVFTYVLEDEAAHAPELGASSAPLVERVRTLGRAAIATIPSTSAPDYRARLQRTLATYALAFEIEDHARPLSSAELTRLERSTGLVVKALSNRPLGLRDVRTLLGRKWDRNQLELAGVLSSAKLSPDEICAVFEGNLQREASMLVDHPETIAPYCRWVLKLKAHFARLNVEFEMPAHRFRELVRRSSNHSLALLAHCLVHQSGASSQATLERDVAHLDATLALFSQSGARFPNLLARLDRTEVGLGRRTHPRFAEWLDADDALDRYLTLAGLSGREGALPRALLEDFERADRTERERSYLEALPVLDERQRARLDFLARDVAPEPRRTRARLARRIEQLTAETFRTLLDEQLKAVLQQAFGIRPTALDEAWRDAVRFYLSTEANHALLGELLRFASQRPGAAIDVERPACQAWIERAGDLVDVERWLDRRERKIEIANRSYTLAVERDPLQVLRMGIPFGTCLSIRSGFNAAATVITALDVNKQVLYLRAPDGAIVGRQLIAISERGGLLPFEVYCALGDEDAAVARAAFADLCEAIADDCGLALTVEGRPEMLHGGFWYCDPPEHPRPGATSAEVIAYCASLGRSPPAQRAEKLEREAAVWRAMETGDVAGAVAGAGWSSTPAVEVMYGWLRATLPPERLTALCEGQPRITNALVRNIARDDPHRAVAWLTEVDSPYARDHEVAFAIAARHVPDLALADALIRIAEASRASGRRFDDHGPEHATFYDVAAHLTDATLDTIFALADRLDPIWRWVVTQSDYCIPCRERAEQRWLEVSERAYVYRPDPDAVLACLRTTRRSGLAHRTALRIAARFALEDHAIDPIFRRSKLAPRPSVVRALRHLADARPELARGDLEAATVRHAIAPHDVARGVSIEALGSVVRHLDLATLPAHPVDLERWPPSPWALYAYRRTPHLKAQLRRAPPDDRIARWMGAIGDVEGAERSAPERTIEAAFVAAQIDGVPDSLSALDRIGREPIVDLTLVDEAERRLETDEAWSLRVLDRGLELDPWLDLIASRLDSPTEAVRRAWRHTLSRPFLGDLPRDVVARLAAIESLRPALGDWLSHVTHDDVWARFSRYAEIPDADELLVATLRTLNPTWPEVYVETDDDVTRLARAAAEVDPERWVGLAIHLPDFRSLARFLDASAPRIASERIDLSRALERIDDECAETEWIRAALA